MSKRRVNSTWPKARSNRMSTDSNNAIGKYCEPKSRTRWRGRRMWMKNFAIYSRFLPADGASLNCWALSSRVALTRDAGSGDPAYRIVV